jgi:glycolate oxidase
MGLEVVLSDGTVLLTGGKAIKNVTGYNLTSLFTGSEGTLGIITKVLVRVIPMPKKRGTLQLMFRTLDDGCTAVHRMLQSGLVPAAAEVMDRFCLEAVAKHRKTEHDPAIGACIVIEIDGEDDEALQVQTKRMEEVARQCGVYQFRIAQSQQESDELWAIRRGISSAIASLVPNRLGEDISVPRDAFPEAVRRIAAIAEKHRITIAVYGHAGDGNIHPSILCDLSKPGEEERVHRAVEDLFDATLAVGGTLSGEHGIGITKRPYIAKALGEAGVKALGAVKQALDPKGILNPGKIW